MIDFIKGHMGGDEIVLLRGDQLPEEDAVKDALKILDAPHIRGHQAGILYEGKNKGVLRVKIVGASERGFISMCGGLTQVLGKALVETDLSKYFKVTIERPISRVMLETDDGLFCIDIEIDHRKKVKRVWTNMTPYVNKCYKIGIQPIKVAGIEALKVGEYLVMDADCIKKKYPNANFKAMDEATLKILEKIQLDWNRKWYSKERRYLYNFSLYDMHPEHGGNLRAVFPHNVLGGYIEPACGTGSVAMILALTALGKITDGFSEVSIECGGNIGIGGPDISTLRINVKDGRVANAYFSHSLVELLAIGKAYI